MDFALVLNRRVLRVFNAWLKFRLCVRVLSFGGGGGGGGGWGRGGAVGEGGGRKHICGGEQQHISIYIYIYTYTH